MPTITAEYLFNGADSGTGPTTVLDNTGNSNTLTIDYSSGDAQWGLETAGRFLDFTASPITTDSAIAELADIANNGNIGTSLDGVTSCWFICVVKVDSGDASGARIFHIGASSGNGELGLVADAFATVVRVSGTAVADFPALDGDGTTVVACNIDTTEATQADRVKVWYDGVAQTVGTAATPLNDTIDCNSSTFSMCVGNRPSQNRNFDGHVSYLAVGTGNLTSQEISDSATDLAAEHDLSPFGPPPPSILDIDNDNQVRAGQTSVDITTQSLTTPITPATLGGEALTITGTPTASLTTVDVPAAIDLAWGETHQLQLTDASGNYVLNGVTLLAETGWEYVVYNGTAPNETTTESFREFAKTDAGVGSYTMVSGDILAWETQTGLSVDAQTVPVVNPAATVTGQYKIWDNTLGTWSSESTFTITEAVVRANYSVTVQDGYLHAGGGDSRAPVAVALTGDSNLCGDGDQNDTILDTTTFKVFSQSTSGGATLVTNTAPLIDHAINSGADEVGPDLGFCHALAVNEFPWRKMIALGGGDSGSGFSTGQYNSVSGDCYLQIRELGNAFYDDYPFGEIVAIMTSICTNDINDYSPISGWTTVWHAYLDDLRDATCVNDPTQKQPTLATVPIVINGIPPEYLPADAGRIALQAEVDNTPSLYTYTAVNDDTGVRSKVGELIHVQGSENREFGYTAGYAAYLVAEANT